jgi:hypothetical protein
MMEDCKHQFMSKYHTGMDRGDEPWFVGSHDTSHRANN